MKKVYISSYKFNSVFIKTFIMIILCSIIPVLAANAIIYKQSTATIQEQACANNMDMLSKTNKAVDLLFKQVDQTMIQLAKDGNVLSFIMNPDETMLSRNKTIHNNLQNILYTNRYISSIYIYSRYNNIIISPEVGVSKLDKFSDKEWLKAYNKFFTGTYRLETRQVSNVLDKQFNCITFIRSLPYNSWSKVGAVVINIDEEKFYDIMLGLDESEKDRGSFYVINRNGTIISHGDKSKLFTDVSGSPYIKRIMENDKGYFIENVKGKSILFSYLTSEYNDWKYIYEVPLIELQDNSKVVSRVIFFTTLIYILLGLIFSYLISKGIYHPIEKLMNLVLTLPKTALNNNIKAKNEYEFLGNAYNDVIYENKNISSKLNNFKPMIKEKLFTNLILGKNDCPEEISERLDFLDINFGTKKFVVIAVQIDDYNSFRTKFNERERNLYKIQLTNAIEDIISTRYKGVCVEVETNKLAAVICYDGDGNWIEGRRGYLDIGERIKSEAESHFPFTITLGIGKMYEDIVNIKYSYNEAVNALEYKLYQGKNEIISIDDIYVQSEELHYFDSEKEKMILNNLKIGEKEQVEILIHELIQEILDNRNISHTYVQQIFIRLLNFIVELIINMGMTIEEIFSPGYNLYKELETKETIKDIEKWLFEICGKIADSVNTANHRKSQKNAEKILEYIDQHISDNISLNEIADWIGFSTTYVSKLVKEYTGKSYIDYLNGSRIEKAKQLLGNTQLSIKETGFRVGFNSIQTFMRTFKKYEGITPGQFRGNM